MVVKGYTVAQLFLCQPLKTGRFLVLKLKLIREDFLVQETLPSFPSKTYTEVSSQLWLNPMEYLPKGSRTGRVDRWGTHTDVSKQTWKEFPGRFGGCASWLTDYVNYYSRGISSTEWSEKRIFEGRTKGKGWLSYLWGAMAKPCLLFIFCFSSLLFFLWHSKYIYSI